MAESGVPKRSGKRDNNERSICLKKTGVPGGFPVPRANNLGVFAYPPKRCTRFGGDMQKPPGLFSDGKKAKIPRACNRLGAIGDFEFTKNIADMMLNSIDCDHQCFRNLLV